MTQEIQVMKFGPKLKITQEGFHIIGLEDWEVNAYIRLARSCTVTYSNQANNYSAFFNLAAGNYPVATGVNNDKSLKFNGEFIQASAQQIRLATDVTSSERKTRYIWVKSDGTVVAKTDQSFVPNAAYVGYAVYAYSVREWNAYNGVNAPKA